MGVHASSAMCCKLIGRDCREQVGYWSLFVDGLFEHGMSHKGATYTNTNPLAADTTFEVRLQCWCCC